MIDSGKYVVFSSDLGGYTNPLTIDYGFVDWKKVNIIHAATAKFPTTPQMLTEEAEFENLCGLKLR